MKLTTFLRPLRIALLALALLVTLAGLIVVFENWHGPRALEAERKRLLASGESLDLKSFFPPPLPPEKNFMADPFLQMVDERRPADPAFTARYNKFGKITADSQTVGGVWRAGTALEFRTWGNRPRNGPEISPQKVIAAFAPIEADILQLRRRAEECSQAQVDSSTKDQDSEYVRQFPQLSRLSPQWKIAKFFGFHQALTLRAAAELTLGHSSDAYADTRILMRMVRATDSVPMVLDAMVGCAMNESVIQIFWQGIVTQSWSEAQLEGFRDYFVSIDFAGSFVRGLRGERVVQMTVWSSPKTLDRSVSSPYFQKWSRILNPLGPGFSSENALSGEAAIEKAIACFDPVARRFDIEEAERYIEREKSWTKRINPYRGVGSAMSRYLILIEASLAKRLAAEASGGLVAALEIYHHTHDDYPVTLDDLVPQYLPRIPTNIMTGQLPAYVRIDPAHFRLTSGHWHDGASAPEWIWHSEVAASQ